MKKNNHEVIKQAQINAIKIILTGGGTLGSVTPLLAIADELLTAEPNKFSLFWLGTSQGVERQLTANYPIKYQAIAAGKLRRYFSLRNLIDVFALVIGFWQALFILIKHKPKLVISAGSFVSVPVVWAAKLLGIKSLIHQQDIRPGLANKLMAPCASVITVAFEKSLADYGAKALWVGNPVRKEFKDYKNLVNNKIDLPTILVLGGGTGSEKINFLIRDNLATLTTVCKLIHITGKHDRKPLLNNKIINNYQCYDLLDTAHTAQAMGQADLVIARAGLGTLSELAYLGKPSVIIPIPESHQEDNAQYFADSKAIFLLKQDELIDKIFLSTVRDLIYNEPLRKNLAHNMSLAMKQGANEVLRDLIIKLVN